MSIIYLSSLFLFRRRNRFFASLRLTLRQFSMRFTQWFRLRHDVGHDAAKLTFSWFPLVPNCFWAHLVVPEQHWCWRQEPLVPWPLRPSDSVLSQQTWCSQTRETTACLVMRAKGRVGWLLETSLIQREVLPSLHFDKTKRQASDWLVELSVTCPGGSLFGWSQVTGSW